MEIGRYKKMHKMKRASLILTVFVLAISILWPLATVKAQDQPLFHVTIIAPGNANLVRRQWGQIFAQNLQLLGIDARVVYLNWAPVYDRVLTPPYDMVGKTYDDGGYDIQLIGWTPGLIPEPRQIYYGGDPAFFAPDGQNYYLWNNTDANLLLDKFITSTNKTEQGVLLKEWQAIYKDAMPCSEIFYSSAPAVVSPVFENWFNPQPNGEGWSFFNVQPYPELLDRTDGKTTAVYCSTGEIESLLPPLSNSWYDTIILANIFSGLARTWPDLKPESLAAPDLLESWNSSTDGFTWYFNCRHGVTWHDGEPFTADDVVYSLWALMNSAAGSQFVGYYQSVYGNNVNFTFSDGTSAVLGNGTRLGRITAVDPYTVKAELPVLALGKPYGYFDPYLLSFATNIIPKHIFENIAPANWTSSPFNTGQGSIVINGTTYTGPLGTGPYKWVDFNPVTQLVHLQKFDNYWNRTALEAEGYYKITDYYIKFIADKTSALAALKNGEVDILDPQYQMQIDVPSIDPAWGKVLLNQGTGRQEIGYNMRHPIFGTGVDTPLGKSDPSKAAEAAKYVRQAFDYAIPRQLIIDNLLAGYGVPGCTPMLPTQAYFDPSVTPRAYNLTASKELLSKAGYGVPTPPPPPTIPSFVLGMSLQLHGFYTIAGVPMPNRELSLYVTTNNATYATTGLLAGRTVTGLDGFYSFSVTPSETGWQYYWIFDRLGAAEGGEWTYAGAANVSSINSLFTPYYDLITQLNTALNNLQSQVDALSGLQDSINNATNIGYVAIAIAVILGIIAIILALRKR